jgi:ABC-2 type transport system permease protein
MIGITLFLVRLLRKPIEWMGADYVQLRLILQTKLTLDFRRAPSAMNASGRKKQTFSRQLIIFVILGIFISFGFFAVQDVLLSFTIAYAIIMVMLSTTLISEFTSVLFDQRDNQIILVRPISNRTLLLSRLLHIQFYLMYIGLALGSIATVVTLIKFGPPTALFFLAGILLCTWISLLFTSLFYIFISKFVNGEQFKDIITYVQIFLGVIIMGGYQLLPRMMEFDGIKNFTMTVHAYTYLIPPAWLAAWIQLSMPENLTKPVLFLAVPALVFAFGGGILLVRFLSGGFANILAQTGESSGKTKKVKKNNSSPATGIYRLLCISEIEKTGWKLAMAVTSKDRKFKQAVYPAYGFMIVMAFVMLKPDFNNLAGWYEQLKDSSRFLAFIFFGFFAANSVDQIRYTDTPEANWVYRALPIPTPGHVLTGAIKAVLIKYFLPIYILLVSIATFIWGWHVTPLMILGAILVVTSTLVTQLFQNITLPFTQPREMQQKGSNFIKIIVGTLIMGGLIGLVYLATFLPVWAVCGIGLIAVVSNVFIYRHIRNIKFNVYTE